MNELIVGMYTRHKTVFLDCWVPGLLGSCHIVTGCCVKGGRDRRGGPILTFPAQNTTDCTSEDIIATISYLVIIPR